MENKDFEHFAFITLFDNSAENPDGKRPVYSGNIEFPDKSKMQVALWEKVSPTGKKYLSGRITKKNTEHNVPPAGGITIGAKSAPAASVPSGSTYTAVGGGDGDLPF